MAQKTEQLKKLFAGSAYQQMLKDAKEKTKWLR